MEIFFGSSKARVENYCTVIESLQAQRERIFMLALHPVDPTQILEALGNA